MYKRRRATFTAEKTFFRPSELTERLNMSEEKIITYARGAGALYAVGTVRLINLPLLLEVFERCGRLSEKNRGFVCRDQ